MKKEAKYYIKTENKQVQCVLCPHNCIVNEGQSGICKVRTNIKGKLYSDNYAQVSAIHVDPIEKKPLYHYYPGKNILSIGSIGCNLKCKFCQNSSISQIRVDDFKHIKVISPEFIIKEALKTRNNIGIAYTYNEPTVWFEYMYDIAKKAHKAKLKNVVVTNGYINEKPLEKLLKYTDAFNIDIKAFTEEFYHEHTGSSLQPVLETIKRIVSGKKHLEITNLIIPNLNDSEETFKELLNELVRISGKNTVLHISRYYPAYKLKGNPTPKKTILKLFDIAKRYLNYVYIGNMIAQKGNDTLCPACGEHLIVRDRYMTRISGLEGNQCLNCNYIIELVHD